MLAIGSFYKDYLEIGAANPNMLAVGLPGYACAGSPNQDGFAAGVLLDGSYSDVKPLEMNKIAEYINSAWYTYTTGNESALPPFMGETTPNYTGPVPPFSWLSDQPKYSWTKIPRYDIRHAGRP